MSLRLLVDEDTQAKALVAALRSAGHDVRTVSDEGLDGSDDVGVLGGAVADDRAVLTRNADDFAELHETSSRHAGIVVIYESPTKAKNMTPDDVVRALGNLDRSGIDVREQLVPLNAWNF